MAETAASGVRATGDGWFAPKYGNTLESESACIFVQGSLEAAVTVLAARPLRPGAERHTRQTRRIADYVVQAHACVNGPLHDGPATPWS